MKGLREIINTSENHLQGIAAAPGMVIGKAYVYSREELSVSNTRIDDPEAAVAAFHEALAKSKKELNKVFGIAREKMGDVRAAIFEAQLMILDDPVLLQNIEQRIREEKKEPEFVVHSEISHYQELMVLAAESYMKERAHDIEDIKNRIIRNLQKKRLQSRVSEGAIVVSDILTPADTILFTRSKISGYVTDRGGLTSHAAIIARSLDIPAVVGTHTGTHRIKDGDTVVIDGFHGYVFINPTEQQIAYFNRKIGHLHEINDDLRELKDKPAMTTDGREVRLLANVDVTGEIDMVHAKGGKGIGLFRTEQIIEELGEFPDEEQQFKIYNNLATRIYPETVTIRAFDIGGDKVKMLDLKESNPFLGLRGVRFLLENPPLFHAQIRAVLRASVHKNVLFMIPMVSTHMEIKKVKEVIKKCRAELQQEGRDFDKNMKLGIMVEVPAAAVMMRDYAAEVDFVSIGTNDLIQYLMAVDRGNDMVSELYQEFHPAVLRTLQHIINDAKEAGAQVSICGEMASDTLAIPLLIGMGLDALSLSSTMIPSAKRTIRAVSYAKARKLVEDALVKVSEKEIIVLLEKFFKEHQIQRTRYIL